MNKENHLTVKSSDAVVSSQPLRVETGGLLLNKLLPSNFEATSLNLEDHYLKFAKEVIGTNHFLLMLEMAFNEHKSVVITPDNIWLLICQGVSQHIKINKEAFKNSIFGISDEGKITIRVRRDDFIIGASNPWEEIFPEFTKQINTHIDSDLHAHIVLNFSTSTLKETTAFEIAFMDAMSSYFSYEFSSLCGIPEITIKGNKEDYNKILLSLESLRKYGLDWWIDKLMPIIEQFILALEGQPNYDFWSSIYKQKNKSGGPFITGWISNFFPYIKKETVKQHSNFGERDGHQNDMLDIISTRDLGHGTKIITGLIKNPVLENRQNDNLKLDDLSNGIFQVPFKWIYHDKEYEMNFMSGLIGIKEADNTLETDINWVISYVD